MDIVHAVVSWFYENFENPADSTRYESAEGGYQYIWGGPYETREILNSIFDDELDERFIEDIANFLEGSTDVWVPSSRRIQPPEDEIDDEAIASEKIKIEELHQNILKQIADLRSEIAELRLPKFGIGHNGGPFEERPNLLPPLDERDFRDLLVAFDTIGKLPPLPPKSEIAKIETAQREIERNKNLIGEWLGKRGNSVADGFAKEAGKQLFKVAADPRTWIAISLYFDKLVSTISAWVEAIRLFF